MDPGEPGRQRRRQHRGRPEHQPASAVPGGTLLFAEDIADPPQGMDQRPVEAPIDLVPQPVDVDVDDVGQPVELVSSRRVPGSWSGSRPDPRAACR